MSAALLETATRQSEEEQRLTLANVTWEQYETLRDTLDEFPGLRMTYLEGVLEFFMPSPKHEAVKKTLARLIEVYSLETGTRLYGCGSTTYRKKAKARGLESDESYCINQVKEVPDFAIEIIVTSSSLDKLAVYKGLGVPEVWFWQDERLAIYLIQAGEYNLMPRSTILPDLDIDLLVRCLNMPDQFDAVVEFRNALRQL